jgi:hypothetical protein
MSFLRSVEGCRRISALEGDVRAGFHVTTGGIATRWTASGSVQDGCAEAGFDAGNALAGLTSALRAGLGTAPQYEVRAGFNR